MTELSTERTYPSFGRCIYCNGTTELAREHIVPFFLGGRHIITDGSCKKCRDETHAFEGFCAAKIFGHLRGNTAPSRRKKQRPKTRRVEIEHDDGTIEIVDVPFGQEPPTPMAMPILPKAGIMIGRQPSESIPMPPFMWALAVPKDHDERLLKLKQTGRKMAKVSSRFAFGPYSRLLAKIGHGFAVATYGLDAFDHLLPDYILGRDTRFTHVIGGASEKIDADPSGMTYLASVGIATADDEHYIATWIQLLPFLNLPVYEVIAGVAPPELVRAALGKDSPQ